MACIEDNAIVDLVDGRLAPSDRDRALQHVDACALCRRTVAHALHLLPPTGDAEPLAIPFAIGRYVVRDFLGEGAMGVVYRAHEPRIDREVALKVVPPELSDPGQRARLLREARAMGRVSHPGVLAVFDAGIEGDAVYVASELVDGQDLRSLLASDRPALPALLDIFRQAALGLHAAHRAGLVHRDFKPENVLVDRDGRARVADFGLAAAAGDPAHGSGTLEYMAPEQRDDRPVDARADQFAFCVALHEALYGRRPDLPDHPDLPDARAVTVAPASVGGDSVPGRVRRAIARGLAPDPADRFADMHALAEALSPRAARPALHFVALAIAVIAIAVLATTREEPRTDAPPTSTRPAGFVRSEPDPALERARTLRLQGTLEEAAAEARTVAEEARRTGNLERLAEAELLLGKIIAPSARVQDCTAMLLHAIGVAESVGRQDLRAEGLIALAAVEARDPAAAPRAELMIEQARRIIADHDLELRLGHAADYTEALVASIAGRDEDAAAGFARALEGATRALPRTHPFVDQYRWTLAIALGRIGRHDEAGALFEETRREAAEALGETSPRYALRLAAIAARRANTGACATAIAELETALAILGASVGEDAQVTLDVRADLARCLERMDRGDEARAHLREALAHTLETAAPAVVAEAYANLGDLGLRTGAWADAESAYAEALTWAQRGAPGTSTEARMLTRVALVELELGDDVMVRDRLEEALAIHEATEGSAIDLAETELALARALHRWSLDPTRAIALAERARDRLGADGVVEAEHREEIEAWLRERFGPP